MRSIIGAVVSIFVTLGVSSNAFAQFKDYHGMVDPSWVGPTFKLSQDYPSNVFAGETPWKNHNFQTNAREYLYSVLAYVLEGNIEVDWRIGENAKRKWYHVPWMEWDTYGREYVRGLTRERNGNLAELTGIGDTQTAKRAQSWAVGFYNAPGGYTIGQVWKDPNRPNANDSQFPEGTVVAKLLFTEFTEVDVPFLSGSLVWKAAIHKNPSCRRNPPMANGFDPAGCARTEPKDMRLIQLDVAVKDNDAGKTGWVFGTFVFNGNLTSDQSLALPAGAPWNRLAPVGLMWGNNPVAANVILEAGLYQHLGCARRLAGPIDNPISSCLSCHMQSQYLPSSKTLTPAKCDNAPENLAYFVDLAPTDVFDKSVTGAVALDYSLQMQLALRSFELAQPTIRATSLSQRKLTTVTTRYPGLTPAKRAKLLTTLRTHNR